MNLETYSQNLSNLISGGYITCAITLGRDLGLFNELKKLDVPVTSQELADACKSKERYVREWLGCMVTTGIVSLDDSGNYFIPQALKPGLKELNQAFFFPVMATLTEKVKICFRNDGPKGYTYGEMPAEVVDLLEKKIPDCDIALEQILDPVMELRKGPICTILDLGCGGGNLSRALSRRFTDADIYAVDYNTTAIKRATENPNYPDVNNIQFLCLDAKALPSEWTNMFDWVILYDVLHDLSGHVKAMDEVRRVLKEDGIVSLNDPDLHSNVRDNIGDTDVAGVGYAISTVICLPSSMSDGEQSGHGMGWGTENKEEFLTNAGWVVTDKRKVGSHLALNFTCVKKNKSGLVLTKC